jgi:hypothetical protein
VLARDRTTRASATRPGLEDDQGDAGDEYRDERELE